MKAGAPPQPCELPDPEPGPNEVVVALRAAGLCHSDLHILDGEWEFPRPLTLGHEGAGVVSAVGPGVDDLTVGQRVAVFGGTECGRCRQCLAGQPNICPERRHVGLAIDGCFADFVVAPRPAIVPISDDVTFEAATVCCDAVLTPYHALLTVGRLQPGERVAVFGVGGLGHNAVQLAVDRGAVVTAIDPNPSKRAAALAAGAVDAQADGTALGPSMDLAADFVANEQSLLEAQMSVRAGGRTVVVGLGALHATLVALRLGAQENALLGSYWGTREEFAACLDLVASGRLHPLTETHPLDTLDEQVERLRAGNVAGRIILVP